MVCPPSDHLFGGPYRWEIPDDPWFADEVAVASCRCGQPGCRAILMKVTVGDDEIVWSDFHDTAPCADPPNVDFRFDPTQYRVTPERLADPLVEVPG